MKVNLLTKLLNTAIAGLLLSAANAYAADGSGRHYAVLSLVGDNVTVVFDRGATGTNLNANAIEKIGIPDAELDSAALLAVDNLVAQLQPSAKKELLISNDAGLYRLQGNLFRSSSDADVVLEGLKFALKSKPAATHLILITKHRGDARLKLEDISLGHGKLEGLGFYVDSRASVVRTDTGESGLGLISPYAYMTVRLIDLSTWTVIKERTSDNSTSFANIGEAGQTLNAWSALTPEQKTSALKRLIQSTVWDAAKDVLTNKPG
ncbi:hypothetical protein [Undibacterium terreum]|uniref:Uncharacterized protein n=1 Tax=Undibacterium terreum TaxID=1224302 RepID=A0A916XFM6_9BURK|nr:hypothetical protein [Undibacterium terreum]GGC68629.1 hypothetical protein GCM10011396_14590 [Undibacterium terreum]